MDEPIMQMVSNDECPLDALKEVISLDAITPFPHLLIVLHYLRRCKFSLLQNDQVVEQSFQFLQSIYHSNASHLNDREVLYYKAIELWMRGYYSSAAKQLEEVVILYPSDVLALRLAQDAYITAGDTSNALICSLRSSFAFNAKHILHGYYLGILCNGYLAANRLHEAEDVGLRAVEKSQGTDLASLQALMTTYLLLGRSSECNALLDRYSERHENSYACIYCLFFRAKIFIQRGNYSGTLRKIEEILKELDSVAADPELLSLPSMLLWELHLNSNSADLKLLWRNLLMRWNSFVCDHDVILSPANFVCAAIAYAGACNYTFIPPDEGTGSSKDDAKATSLIGTLLQSFRPSAQSSSFGEQRSDSTDNSEDELHEKMKSSSSIFFKKLHDVGNDSGEIGSLNHICLNSSRVPEAPNNCSEAVWLVRSAVIPLCTAFESFMLKDYAKAYALLIDSKCVWYRAGGSRLFQDLLQFTLIEASLRMESLHSTRMLLSERTALVPNDSQSWRRLAVVLTRLGMEEEARGAQYTAWQLGIGQGGFGGPK